MNSLIFLIFAHVLFNHLRAKKHGFFQLIHSFGGSPGAGHSKGPDRHCGKRPLTRPRPSATLSPREREKAIARRSAPNAALALSPGERVDRAARLPQRARDG